MSIKSVHMYINEMRSDLNTMETEGTIDPSFGQKINVLNAEFSRMKQYWVNQKEVSVSSAFIFYSAMHNSNLVLNKMKDRFNKAKAISDNPKIACDSLLIMPIISEVYQKTRQASEDKQKMSPFLPNETLKLVSALRVTAKLAGLLPKLDEEVKHTDNEQLKQTAAELDKKFVVSNLLK